MPLSSRVSPSGELFASPARGMLMGNRGGRLHDGLRNLGRRRWASKQWICCRLAFNGRHRDVWGDGYTELFFLDEVTAFAAGHRPCFECRRKDAEHFAALFSGAAKHLAHERNKAAAHRVSAKTMDNILHAERLDGRTKRLHARALDALPDGAMIARAGEAFAVRGRHLLPWIPEGYGAPLRRPRGIDVDVLTPPSILAVLAAGYRPLWHPGTA